MAGPKTARKPKPTTAPAPEPETQDEVIEEEENEEDVEGEDDLDHEFEEDYDDGYEEPESAPPPRPAVTLTRDEQLVRRRSSYLQDKKLRDKLFLMLTPTAWHLFAEMLDNEQIVWPAKRAKDLTAAQQFIQGITQHPDFTQRHQQQVAEEQAARGVQVPQQQARRPHNGAASRNGGGKRKRGRGQRR